MESPILDSRAYANKELLKEDLSLRVSEAINSAGALYEALAFAPQRIEEIPPEFDIEKAEVELATSKGILKDMAQDKIDEAHGKVSGGERKIYRIVEPTTFKVFLIDFYKLWLESKDSVKKWNRETTKEEIAELFSAMMQGRLNIMNPNIYSGCLLLFEDYMNALANSGIIDFKTKTFKAGIKIGSGN